MLAVDRDGGLGDLEAGGPPQPERGRAPAGAAARRGERGEVCGGDGVGAGVAAGAGEAVGAGTGDTVAVGSAEVVGWGVADAVAVAVAVGLAVGVGVGVGVAPGHAAAPPRAVTNVARPAPAGRVAS